MQKSMCDSWRLDTVSAIVCARAVICNEHGKAQQIDFMHDSTFMHYLQGQHRLFRDVPVCQGPECITYVDLCEYIPSSHFTNTRPLSHSPASRISCSDQPDFDVSASALSDFQDDAEWSLQASRVPSVLSSLFTSPRVQICRGVQCIITTWTWHGPYSSLVRLTGANARTQSLTQMRYQMATLISACMTGTWVGRYPLSHAIVTWGAPCTVDCCEPKWLCMHDRTSRLSDRAAEND